MIKTGSKVVKGVFWVAISRGLFRIFSFAKIIILARLLTPEDFGLMGIALITISLIEAFSVTGIDAALIQKKEGIEKYIDTAWVISIFRGIVLFIIVFFLCPYISLFFNEPQSVSILRATSFIFLIRGFINAHIVYFPRELDFKKQLFIDISDIIPDFCFSVGYAMIFKDVWALVFGFIAGVISKTIFSFLIIRNKPVFKFNLSYAKELSKFGRWVWGSNIVIFLSNKIDSVVSGKFLGTIPLGFYQMAYKVSILPVLEVASVVGPVIFPSFSRIQEDPFVLKNSFMKILKVVFMVAFPLSLFLVLFSSQIVFLILGEKWQPIILSIKLLAIAGFVRAFTGMAGYLFYAKGVPKWNFFMSFCRVTMLFIIIVPLTLKFGINGTSFSILCSNLMLFFVFFYGTRKFLNVRPFEYWKIVVFPLFSAIVVNFMLFVVFKFIQTHNILIFCLFTTLGIAGYGLLIYNFEKDLFRQIIKKEGRL